MTSARFTSAVFYFLLLTFVLIPSEAFVGNKVGKRAAKVNIEY